MVVKKGLTTPKAGEMLQCVSIKQNLGQGNLCECHRIVKFEIHFMDESSRVNSSTLDHLGHRRVKRIDYAITISDRF